MWETSQGMDGKVFTEENELKDLMLKTAEPRGFILSLKSFNFIVTS